MGILVSNCGRVASPLIPRITSYTFCRFPHGYGSLRPIFFPNLVGFRRREAKTSIWASGSHLLNVATPCALLARSGVRYATCRLWILPPRLKLKSR
jgi:hypothetical protein